MSNLTKLMRTILMQLIMTFAKKVGAEVQVSALSE